ncbi:LacI family DNA-binding transcriptional regulator [Arthrobacter sp. LAPM80]|uniref:LacI family DNA-binding transcriptional regulator n=1 Tax=Arthrobacter sp. LAPM80 TaxID=3141788 RepID=UPI00398AA4FD
MPVKLTEVARHAGVSLATASRVLNGSARKPAAGIAERVQAAATELGYVANAQAQALARSTTGLVGLVVHDIADPYFSAIAHGVQQAALDAHHQVLLASTDIEGDAGSPAGAELAAVNAFISYRTDAIILAASRLLDEDPRLIKALSQYVANGGRVVTLGASAIADAHVVHVENHDGAAALVGALLEQGVDRFVILAGPHERNTARVRVAGFTDRIAAAGGAPVAVVHGAFTSKGGHDSTVEYLDSPTAALLSDGGSPLCFLAANDVMALGAMTALRSRGLRIPQDVQVAGFDDIPTLRDHFPGLTTFRLPLEEIGRIAAQLALTPAAKQSASVTGSVVLRESAGVPR